MRPRRISTTGQAAAALLIARRPADVERLCTFVKAIARGTVPCSGCGDRGPHAGARAGGEDLAFRCRACGLGFHPEPVEVAL